MYDLNDLLGRLQWCFFVDTDVQLIFHLVLKIIGVTVVIFPDFSLISKETGMIAWRRLVTQMYLESACDFEVSSFRNTSFVMISDMGQICQRNAFSR